MACQTLIVDTAANIVVFLSDTSNVPVTGLTFSDVSGSLKKGAGAFSVFTFTGANFTEISDGYYQISLAAADTDTLGNLYLSITGAAIQTSFTSAFVASVAPAAVPSVATAPATTTLFGFVYDSSAAPVYNATVSASILSQPTVLFTPEGMTVEGGIITATTDAEGFFALTLIEGALVDVFIPSANFRRTLTVPAADTNLFSIA